MNKPASELIALADELMAQNFGHVAEVEKMGPHFDLLARAAQALRTAANQSGPLAAGLDALREALGNRLDELTDAVNTNRALSARVNGKVILKRDKVRAFVLPVLATPPAQPAPAATHGKAVEAGQGVMKNGRYFNTGQTYNADGTLRYDFDAANSRDPWFNGDTFHGYDDEGCPIWNRTRS